MLSFLISLIGFITLITSIYYFHQAWLEGSLLTGVPWLFAAVLGVLLVWQPWSRRRSRKVGKKRLPSPEQLQAEDTA